MVRTVRDKRYVYVRNYMPHKIYGQHIGYMFEMPTAQVWKKGFESGTWQGVLVPASTPPAVLALALLFAGGMNLFAWWNSDRIVLRMQNAQPIGPHDATRHRAAQPSSEHLWAITSTSYSSGTCTNLSTRTWCAT